MKLPFIQVEGKYLFHPYLVHFPIAFFILEAFLVLLWVSKKEEIFEKFSYEVLKIAVFTMPLVMLAGYMDSGGLSPRIQAHFFMAVGLFVLNSARLIVRWKSGPLLWRARWRKVYAALILVGVLLTVLTGHFGGKLVYF